MSPFSDTDTTRCLCAAAHLDVLFRNRAIRQLVEEHHRAAGPSPGVDEQMVVQHCLAARRRKTLRNVLITLLLLLLAPRSVSLTAQGPAGASSLFQQLSGHDAMLHMPLFPQTWLVLTWIVVLVELWISYYGIVARGLLRRNFQPQSAPTPLFPHRIDAAPTTTDANVVIYRGYSPFVGAGLALGGWSFPVDVTKAKEGQEQQPRPLPFDLKEIYDHIDASLLTSGDPGLDTESKLYVNGEGIRDDERFVPVKLSRPCQKVSSALINQYRECRTERIRYYHCFRVTSWQGDLIISTFLGFARVGKSLYTEVSHFVLPPIHGKYHRVDRLQPWPTWLNLSRLLGLSIITTVALAYLAPIFAAYRLGRPVSLWLAERTTRREIKDNPLFDYGTDTSIRSMVSDTNYHQYLQVLDKEMYIKVVQWQILDSVVAFLDSKNVDTSEIRQRQSMILNQGLIMSGGTIKAESLAIGKQATAVRDGAARIAGQVAAAAQTGANAA